MDWILVVITPPGSYERLLSVKLGDVHPGVKDRGTPRTGFEVWMNLEISLRISDVKCRLSPDEIGRASFHLDHKV